MKKVVHSNSQNNKSLNYASSTELLTRIALNWQWITLEWKNIRNLEKQWVPQSNKHLNWTAPKLHFQKSWINSIYCDK